MATYYLVGTGNWSSSAIWSSSSGGAGGAGVPTTGDIVNLNSATKYTVTLTSNVSVDWLFLWSAKLVFNGYTMTVGGSNLSNANSGIFGAYSSGKSPELDISNSKLIVTTPTATVRAPLDLSDPGLTLTATNSVIELNVNRDSSSDTNFIKVGSSKTYGAFIINIGPSDTRSGKITIQGSGNLFYRLLIRSKNSQAHTVKFTNAPSNAIVYVQDFRAEGSSSSNKLTITDDGSGTTFNIGSPYSGSSYGKYVYIDTTRTNVNPGPTSSYAKPYIGSTSTAGDNWVTQDPPKISTFVDPLTTTPGSNTNWYTYGTVTKVTSGHDGGGYTSSSGNTGSIVTTDTYDLIDSWFVYQLKATTNYKMGVPQMYWNGSGFTGNYGNVTPNYIGSMAQGNVDYDGDPVTKGISLPKSVHPVEKVVTIGFNGDGGGYDPNMFNLGTIVKQRINSNGTVEMKWLSSDGKKWIPAYRNGITLTSEELLCFRSARLLVKLSGGSGSGQGSTDDIVLGSINPTVSIPGGGAFLPFFFP